MEKCHLALMFFLPVELIINNGCTFLLFQPFSVFILDIFYFYFFLDVIKSHISAIKFNVVLP